MMQPSKFVYVIATTIISANYISEIFAADSYVFQRGNNADGTNKTVVSRYEKSASAAQKDES